MRKLRTGSACVLAHACPHSSRCRQQSVSRYDSGQGAAGAAGAGAAGAGSAGTGAGPSNSSILPRGGSGSNGAGTGSSACSVLRPSPIAGGIGLTSSSTCGATRGRSSCAASRADGPFSSCVEAASPRLASSRSTENASAGTRLIAGRTCPVGWALTDASAAACRTGSRCGELTYDRQGCSVVGDDVCIAPFGSMNRFDWG